MMPAPKEPKVTPTRASTILRRAVALLVGATQAAACQWLPGLAPAAPLGAAVPAFTMAEGGGTGLAMAPVGDRDAARARLAGAQVSDFCASLVGSPGRWRDGTRELQAFGDPLPAPSSEWASGLDLTALGCAPGDKATNGAAWRSGAATRYGERVFFVTRQGRFLGLDPAAPLAATGARQRTMTDLRALPGVPAGLQFTKTYVTLSGDGSTAFVLADQGVAFALDVRTALPGAPVGSHAAKLVATGRPCAGAALFADPLASSFSNANTTLYAVTNDGLGLRFRFTPDALPGSPFAGATFALTAPVAAAPRVVRTPFNAAIRPCTLNSPAIGAAGMIAAANVLVQAPPIVLGGVLVVGDRRGYVNVFDFNQAPTGLNPTGLATNLAWPIEAPVAVDVDDALAITDVFVPAGPQLYWLRRDGAQWARYPGQYALMQTPNATKLMTAANLNAFVAMGAPQSPTASAPWQAFSAMHSPTGSPISLNLPGQTGQVDRFRLTHSKVMQGLAPYIYHFSGEQGRPYRDFVLWNGNVPATRAANPPGAGAMCVNWPVDDGEPAATAGLAGPTAIDFDDDGSCFVADTNHCQVLLKPATPTSWQRWWPALDATYAFGAGGRPLPSAAAAASQYFVFAGTLFSQAFAPFPAGNTTWGNTDGRLDIGNGVGGERNMLPALGASAVARGTAINRVHGVAVGNLGLYVSNRNNLTRNAGGGTTNDGEILFIPRVGVTAAFGLTGLQPGRSYVIARFVNGQGITAWRGYPNRDVVFASSMNGGNNQHVVLRLDSAAALPPEGGGIYAPYAGGPGGTGSGVVAGQRQVAAAAPPADGGQAAGVPCLNNPHDVAVDDAGNLFVANYGNDSLGMIWQVVTPPAGAPARRWGVAAPAAGRYYTILRTAQIDWPDSVTFARNDPQVPSGCLYVGLTASGPANGPHRVIRVDESRAFQVVGGAPAGGGTASVAMNDSADSNPPATKVPGTSAAFAFPHRARGDGQGRTYICDRFNNRIRVLESEPGTGEARGYLAFQTPATAFDKVLYQARLRLYYNGANKTQAPPRVAIADPFLRGTGTVWDPTNVQDGAGDELTPVTTPALDFTAGEGTPSQPVAQPWAFTDSRPNPATTYYQYDLPPSAIALTNNAIGQFIRVGLAPPVAPPAAGDYYYPTSIGVGAPYVTSPAFYTRDWDPGAGAPPANLAQLHPRLELVYGTLNIVYPILSPPAIYYTPGGKRYVFVTNANTLFRYDATWGAGPDPAAGWRDQATGAQALYALTEAGRQPGGTVFGGAPASFHFNATPPLVDQAGRVYVLDTRSLTPGSYAYHLNKFNGTVATAATADMAAPQTFRQVATGVPSAPDDNAGIYMTGGSYAITEAYFGLVNGKLYRASLR